MMGGFAPHAPQDLSQFSSRVDGFRFAVIRESHTMEELDRRIGQRRDATRAPTQARSGWRPLGRLLDSPPHHLRNGEILSKQWGPPHYDPSRRKRSADRLLRDAVHPDGGPLVYNGSEEQQRSFDSTCRKLHRFLTQAQP